MTAEHDALRDLIAPVALGAASPDEVARVEAHAAGCAVCREELGALRSATGVLAVAVPQHEPRPELKASIMETVHAEAPGRVPAGPAPSAPRRGRREGRRVLGIPAWPLAAALAGLVAVVLAAGLVVQGTSGDGPGVTARAVTGTPAAPGITGRVVYVPGEDTAVVSLSGLPPLDAGDAYQLWVIRGGAATSAGLLESTGPAQARTVATGLSGADALAVTAQPRASRSVPVPPILVEAPLQSG